MVIVNSKTYANAYDAAMYVRQLSFHPINDAMLKPFILNRNPLYKYLYDVKATSVHALDELIDRSLTAYRALKRYEIEHHSTDEHPQYDQVAAMNLPITEEFYNLRKLLPIKEHLINLINLPTQVNQDLLRKLLPIKPQLESMFK